MKIIIPMAGMGKRMRPHSLTVPKPLIPVAGKPIVQRLVEDIAQSTSEHIDEVAFIISRSFGEEVEDKLKAIAGRLDAKASIYYQDEPLGTAHAILCAKPSLSGHLIIAFADTLFKADFVLDTKKDGTIWVQKVEDPRPFGVVKLDAEGIITDFIEKPETPVSNLAIIGVYYIRDGEGLRDEMQHLIDNDIREKGEYQLTNALDNLKKKGARFVPGTVDEWLDCGNKDATVYTNQRILELKKDSEQLVAPDLVRENAVLIEPCWIGEGVSIRNAVVGPHVSIGAGSTIEESRVSNAIIGEQTRICCKVVSNAMVGSHASVEGRMDDLSLGDYSTSC